jgi:L-ascorbate metabolism protein UlaG (beta-lactamase superfamily)
MTLTWKNVRDHVRRLNHDCFRFEAGGKVLYTDPFKIKPAHDADLILISHEHFDHCSPEDVAAVSKKGTQIVASASCRGKLEGNVRFVHPGERETVGGVQVEAVPAYNLDKKFHPKAAGHVGFVFTLDGVRVYFAGDTDLIPEMAEIHCDIALLPVSGTYVMTAREAVEATTRVHAGLIVPMHYGDIIGTAKDAEHLEKNSKVPVEIL